ncbi:MAG TPA: hypothetical protein VHN39_03500 [Phenylobacterium sp.]|jgi:hypothetical protein|nr:hypothetical protein [Phenylobacterium sp.]
MRRASLLALLALPLVVAGCGGGGGGDSAPTPVVTPLPTHFDVQPCLDQVATPGATVANLVIPDTLKLDLSKPSAFPNGRTLSDPVVDIMIAYAFIDLTKHSPRALADLPLDPSGNDVPLRADFPYLGLPQGTHLAPPPSGPNYNFRTDPVSMYVRVDRMGMPAVATLLIGTSAKTAYNDDDPSTDATRKYVSEIQNDLTGLTNALAKDFVARGFALCAKGA